MPQRKLIDLATFRAEARTGKRPEAGVFRMSMGDPVDVGGRKVRFCFSDGSVDRAGDTINPDGWDTTSFMQNPVALWAHNSWEPPIGRGGNLGVESERLMGDIEFASADVYPFAETIYRLVMGKYIRAVSVGFLPLEWSFVEDKARGFGIDFKRQELLEISVVPVPCNANALAEARSKGIDTDPLKAWAERVLDQGGSVLIPRRILEETFRQAKTPHSMRQVYLAPRTRSDESEWKVGASRDLPIEDSDTWDGSAAEASIFEHAGGDEFDPAKVRKGFLIYDAAKPKLRGSYKLPFARVVDGELKAVKGGIRAAASRLQQTDAPQAVLDEARKVIDHYEEKMKKNAKSASRRRDGMSETDPSEGGGTVASCGRTSDEECGMKDPMECAIHAPLQEGDGDDAKALLRKLLREFGKLSGRRRTNGADGNDDPDGDEDDGPQHESMREALVHTKAAGALHQLAEQHHDKARESLQKAVDAMSNPEAEGGKASADLQEHVRAAHGHMKSAEGYSDEAAGHHAKAEAAIEEAIDHIENPEAEGGKAAALRRVRDLAGKHAETTA